MSTPDFFRSRLDAMIDLRHPLAVLANRMPWSLIEATLTPMFERRAREGRMSAEIDLFGVTPRSQLLMSAPQGVRACPSG